MKVYLNVRFNNPQSWSCVEKLPVLSWALLIILLFIYITRNFSYTLFKLVHPNSISPLTKPVRFLHLHRSPYHPRSSSLWLVSRTIDSQRFKVKRDTSRSTSRSKEIHHWGSLTPKCNENVNLRDSSRWCRLFLKRRPKTVYILTYNVVMNPSPSIDLDNDTIDRVGPGYRCGPQPSSISQSGKMLSFGFLFLLTMVPFSLSPHLYTDLLVVYESCLSKNRGKKGPLRFVRLQFSL